MPEETIWQTATEVSRTLVSPAYGALQAAPLLRCAARVGLPTETATAIVSRRGAVHEVGEPTLASMSQAGVQVYELDYHDVSHGFFCALDSGRSSGRNNEPWSFGPWSSDAHLLYCCVEKEKLAHLVVIGGTQVAWQGRQLMKAAAPSEFFEWCKRGAVLNAAAGGLSVTPLFEQMAGGSLDATPPLNNIPSTYAEKH